jgi:hypothetical protein
MKVQTRCNISGITGCTLILFPKLPLLRVGEYMDSILQTISSLAPFGIGIVGMLYWKIIPNESKERKRFMFVGGLCLCVAWAVVLYQHLHPAVQ